MLIFMSGHIPIRVDSYKMIAYRNVHASLVLLLCTVPNVNMHENGGFNNTCIIVNTDQAQQY